jgi:RNA polymerase sigma-70 factor (ECF subfamily)
MSDATGDATELSALFERYKERLRRAVRLRLDPRLTGIVDSSGVLRMVREELDRRGSAPSGAPAGAFLWLRQIAGEVLLRLHQQRLGPEVRGDISLYRGALPEASSISLAAHPLGKEGGPDDLTATAVARAQFDRARVALDRTPSVHSEGAVLLPDWLEFQVLRSPIEPELLDQGFPADPSAH